MRKMPELLAPAGGMVQLKAALHFGADAVYVGMEKFGLRAFAGNFSAEQLREAVTYTHALGKKLYLTMNIFPSDDEMDGFVAAAREAYNMGVDAAIISDLGAILAVREQVPNLHVHVSTQANTLNTRAVSFYHQLGCTRVILAREMTLTQLQKMAKAKPEDIEMETFVHGASCMAYSGRCLLSADMTGRSANKGACAQPCRWKYHVVEEKRPGQYMPVCEDDRGTYIFSAQDLNLLPILPQLVSCGIASLKIEGRMKTEYYVSTVVSAYRQALDALSVSEEAFHAGEAGFLSELNKASHRPSGLGFLMGRPENGGNADGVMQSAEYIARVQTGAPAGQKTTLVLKNRFFEGDEVSLLTPDGPKDFLCPSFVRCKTGETLSTFSIAGEEIQMVFPFDTREGDLLRGPVRNHVKE